MSVTHLRAYWRQHADSEDQLRAWITDAEAASWTSPNQLKTLYASASILGNKRVCFNIKGNAYRLIVAVSYRTGTVLIKWIGSHAEYTKIKDAEKIEMF